MMFTDQPDYRSKSVNTDKFGLREQYDAQGEFIDIETLKTTRQRCNVLLGGSTVFGVGATSDRATISHHLHRTDTPCLNLGVRGATGQQELILFLLFKRYFPTVLNVVLFTGVNDCALAARPGTKIYPGFGGVFYEGMLLSPLRQQELLGVPRYRLTRMVDRAYGGSRLLRGALRVLLGGSPPTQSRRAGFDEKLAQIMSFVDNDLATWGQLQDASGFKVHMVLQPSIGWTRRALTRVEGELFASDLELFPDTGLFASETVYEEYREKVEASCLRNGIDFHDANVWLDDPQFAAREIFTDVCHLTDAGNAIVGAMLSDRLAWREQ